MKRLSIKTQEKVLKTLIEMIENSNLDHLYRPQGFEKNFSFLPKNKLKIVLDILEQKKLIHMSYADFPNSFNIYTLSVTPKGNDYFPQKSLATRLKWKERAYGFCAALAIWGLKELIIWLVHG